MKKPSRDRLFGLSYSEFKTELKKMGHKVPRNLNSNEYVTEHKGRYYRFRHWEDQFFVDVSCRKSDFDRWANSVDERVTIEEFFEVDDLYA